MSNGVFVRPARDSGNTTCCFATGLEQNVSAVTADFCLFSSNNLAYIKLNYGEIYSHESFCLSIPDSDMTMLKRQPKNESYSLLVVQKCRLMSTMNSENVLKALNCVVESIYHKFEIPILLIMPVIFRA